MCVCFVLFFFNEKTGGEREEKKRIEKEGAKEK